MTLRLLAFDPEDLAVLSAHLERARLSGGDIRWLPAERRFMLVARAAAGDAVLGLRIDRAVRAERLNFSTTGDTPLLFVGALFEPLEPPGGRIVLLFDRSRSIRLTVECIEAALGELETDAEKA